MKRINADVMTTRLILDAAKTARSLERLSRMAEHGQLNTRDLVIRAQAPAKRIQSLRQQVHERAPERDAEFQREIDAAKEIPS